MSISSTSPMPSIPPFVRPWLCCLLLACLLSWAAPRPSVAAPPLVIGSDAGFPLSTATQGGLLDLLVKEAFTRIGKEAVIVPLPSERSLQNANQGLIDGDLVRVAGLERRYPNLVAVPEKTCDFEFVAFSKGAVVAIDSWPSLRPFQVGIIRGWKILEENLPEEITTKVADGEQLFALLDKGRVDLVVHNRLEGYGVVRQMGLTGIQALDPPLARREMFLYLHRRHGELASQVGAALRQMKADGAYQAIVERILNSLGDQGARP